MNNTNNHNTTNPNTNNRSRTDLAVFFVLVAAGVLGRFLWKDSYPNFAPVAAAALFAGYYFRQSWQAILVPLTTLVISNYWLPMHDTMGVLAVTYLAMLFPIGLRGILRDRLSPFRLGVCSIAPSVVFFTSTNLAVWWFNKMYTADLAGLLACFSAAIPFYKYTLAGDLIFTGVFFGTYAALSYLAPSHNGKPAYAEQPESTQLR